MRLTKLVMIAAVATGIGALGGMAPSKAGEPKAEKPKLRVGVFDSRAVALTYGQTPEEPGYAPHFKRLMEDFKKAKAAGDAETSSIRIPTARPWTSRKRWSSRSTPAKRCCGESKTS